MEHQPPSFQPNKLNDSLNQNTLLQRIWKFKLHYLIVMPALLLIVIFKLLPFVNGIMLSLVDYKIFLSVFESSWVGLTQFTQLFADETVTRVIMNTFVIKAGYILASGAVAFLLTLALSSIQTKLLRGIFSSLFLIPFFIPSVVFASIFIYVLSPNTSPFLSSETMILADTALIRPIIIFVEVLKTCGIPIVIGLAAIASKHAAFDKEKSEIEYSRNSSYRELNIVPALRAVAAFMVLQLSTILSSDFELIRSFLNPLNAQTAETIDSFVFKIGITMVQISPAAALGLVQFGIQFIFTICAYFIVRGQFLNDLFTGQVGTAAIKKGGRGSGLIGVITACLYSLAVLYPLYLLFIKPFTTKGEMGQSVWDYLSIGNVISYTAINFIAVIVFLLMTVTLAYPLTVKHLPGKSIYKVFLLIVISMGSGMIYEFVFARNLQMLNTIFPQLFFGFFSLTSVFVLKSIFNARFADKKAEAEASGRGELHTFFTLFIPNVWKPLLALGALHFVMLWNSYYPSLVYIASPESQSPIMKFTQLSMSGEIDHTIVMQLGALLSLPPILLFLIFRRWLTAEVFIGQIRKL